MQHRRTGWVAALCLLPLLLQASIASAARMAAEPETGPPARELVELSPVSLEAMVLAEGPRPPIRRPRDVENVPPQLREEGALPKAPEIPEDARCPQWWGLAKEVGWGVGELPHLDVVIYRESRCLPEVHNRKDPNGGSRGLTQINGSWTRWLRERGVVDRVEDLFDPETNLRAALLIYRYGIDRYEFGWGPWGFRYVYPYSE